MRRFPGFLVLCLAALAFVVATAVPLQGQVLVASPDHRNQVTVETRDGRLSYSLARDGRALILPSLLGFEFQGAPPLRDGLRITKTARQSHDEWLTQPWDNARAWSIPSNWARMDRSEMLYSSGPVSLLDSLQTPLTMQTEDGRTFMVIHEANLVDYARMFLRGTRTESRLLTAALAPMSDGIKVRGRTPFVTPWRTIQLTDRATGLAPAVLGLNLNPPNALGRVGARRWPGDPSSARPMIVCAHG